MDNLSMDAARAKSDGMTYGVWKVLHPNTMGEVVVNENIRTCPNCGETFFTKGKKIYCDSLCQKRAEAKRRRERMANG